jgi:hypothetical protein
MNIDEYEASLKDGQDSTPSIEETIRDIATDEPAALESEPTEPESPQTPDTEEPKADPEPPKEEAEPEKPKQTPEENARFAEQRRQQQIEKRVQEEMSRLRNEDPAFKLAKTLENLYGMPVDQVLSRIEQARIEKEAEDRSVPVDQVQREYAERAKFEQEKVEIQSVKEENNQLQYELWKNRMITEELNLRKAPELAGLSDEDFQAAQTYMLQTMRNPNASLEEAVYAVHGRKIADSLKEIARNDALAQLSGREKGGLPPQGGKSPSVPTLTDDEKYVAQQLGLTEEEYLKWKI